MIIDVLLAKLPDCDRPDCEPCTRLRKAREALKEKDKANTDLERRNDELTEAIARLSEPERSNVLKRLEGLCDACESVVGARVDGLFLRRELAVAIAEYTRPMSGAMRCEVLRLPLANQIRRALESLALEHDAFKLQRPVTKDETADGRISH